MNIIDLEQGTPTWEEWRKGFRMASESPALLGLSPWMPKTPLQLFEVKSGLVILEQNPAMRHGLAHEARAREQYEWDHDRPMPPCIVEHDGYGASLDGRSEDGRRVLEIKSPVRGKESDLWAEAWIGSVPMSIAAQIQHQLMVSGAEACDLVVYAADIDSYELVSIAPDPALQAQIRAAWEQFWPLYASQTPPPPIEGDFIERFDAEWLDLETRYLAAQAVMQNAAAAEAQLREALLALAGEASCRGEALRVTRYWARGGVDYRAIPELKGVDLDTYRKRGGYRFRLGEARVTPPAGMVVE